MYRIPQMFSIVLKTAKGTLRNDICTEDSSENFDSVFSKEIEKIICVCAV